MDASKLSNLRCDVPVFDTPELSHLWNQTHGLLIKLRELDLPCALTVGTRRMLFQLINAMHATDVLEIGTYTGATTVALAYAVRKTLGRVVTVDLNDVNGPEGHWVGTQRGRAPNDLMDEAGVSEVVDFVTMDSVAFLTHSARNFDLIIIDGWHEEECVYQEIPLAIERLKPNGIIFMDDIQVAGPPPGFDVIEGPWRAVQRHLQEGLDIEVHFVQKTLDDEDVALAFLTRKTQ